MTRESFQLSGSAAAIYEEQKVPAIFGPLAEATLDTVTLFDDDSVLDVACGTGIVARKARERIGPSARIVGVDLNEGMIDAARNLTDGLMAYYPFSGNTNDESGNGNDGTVNGATLTQDRFGNSDSAYNFDGIDDYIMISSSASLDIRTSVTLSAWVSEISIIGEQQHIVSNYDKTNTK